MKIVKMRPGKGTSLPDRQTGETPAEDHCKEQTGPGSRSLKHSHVRDDEDRNDDDGDLFQGEDFVDDEIDWEYQGKSRHQVEGSYRIFALCLLLFFIGLLIWICQ